MESIPARWPAAHLRRLASSCFAKESVYRPRNAQGLSVRPWRRRREKRNPRQFRRGLILPCQTASFRGRCEKRKIRFLRRHVRRGKHHSARKRGICPPEAGRELAQSGRSPAVGKGIAFFDSLKNEKDRFSAVLSSLLWISSRDWDCSCSRSYCCSCSCSRSSSYCRPSCCCRSSTRR